MKVLQTLQAKREEEDKPWIASLGRSGPLQQQKREKEGTKKREKGKGAFFKSLLAKMMYRSG